MQVGKGLLGLGLFLLTASGERFTGPELVPADTASGEMFTGHGLVPVDPAHSEWR